MCGDADRANCGVYALLKELLNNPDLSPDDLIDQYQELQDEIGKESDY